MEEFNKETIGLRLKVLRLSKGLSARTAAQKLGVSPAYVSMLERGKCNFSLVLLLKFMDLYEETLSDFLKPSESGDRVRHLKDIQQFSEDNGKMAYRLIRFNEDPSVFRPYRFDLQPGGSTGICEQHRGTEFIYVLDGKCVVTLAKRGSKTSQRYLMHASDSIYYSSSEYHCISNESDAPSSFLLFFAPHPEEDDEARSEDNAPVT